MHIHKVYPHSAITGIFLDSFHAESASMFVLGTETRSRRGGRSGPAQPGDGRKAPLA